VKDAQDVSGAGALEYLDEEDDDLDQGRGGAGRDDPDRSRVPGLAPGVRGIVSFKALTS